MLDTINSYMKYVYYALGAILLVVLIMLLVKAGKVSKTLKKSISGVNDINEKINIIKEKTDYLKQSFSTSWAFFIEIIGIIEIIKIVIRDYRATPKQKRSMIKSAAYGISRKPYVIGGARKF